MSLEVLGGGSGNEQLQTQLFNFDIHSSIFPGTQALEAIEDKEISSSPEDLTFKIKLF